MSNDQKTAEEIFLSIDFERIIDHPNILISAAFWEPERYRAARVCYKILRQIDDMVDDHKAAHGGVSETDRQQLTAGVERWLALCMDHGLDDQACMELSETIEKFRIPLWPLEDFARSMIYDINNEGFKTLEDFITYSNGASVAPAGIFVHLCGLRRNGMEYLLPEFDVRDAATPCALFSYIVHIIRDFRKDQLNNLNYFAGDMMEKRGLTTADLRRMAEGEPLSDGFRSMIADYMEVADSYRIRTLEVIREISPKLGIRHRLSLEIIFNLYLMVFERIDQANGSFTAEELVPAPADTWQRVREVIDRFFSREHKY